MYERTEVDFERKRDKINPNEIRVTRSLSFACGMHVTSAVASCKQQAAPLRTPRPRVASSAHLISIEITRDVDLRRCESYLGNYCLNCKDIVLVNLMMHLDHFLEVEDGEEGPA